MAGPFTLKTHIPHFVDFAHGNEDEFLYGYLYCVINGISGNQWQKDFHTFAKIYQNYLTFVHLYLCEIRCSSEACFVTSFNGHHPA